MTFNNLPSIKKIICSSFISQTAQMPNAYTSQKPGRWEPWEEAFYFPGIISRKINILSERYSLSGFRNNVSLRYNGSGISCFNLGALVRHFQLQRKACFCLWKHPRLQRALRRQWSPFSNTLPIYDSPNLWESFLTKNTPQIHERVCWQEGSPLT